MRYSSDDLKEISEANVRKDFIDPLFESLGWNVRDHNEYDSERYIRNEEQNQKFGYVDIALKINQKPVIFIEAKRFGKVSLKEKRQLKKDEEGKIIKIDWFSEERQVLNYAAQRQIKWAVLTNFEIFRVFNALNGLLVLEIESPSEYLSRLNEIILLHKDFVINGQINKLETRIERPDVDLNFLSLIKEWRRRIATSFYSLNQELFSNTNLESLKGVTQRVLDRLIIIRFAEDRFILDPDQLLDLNNSWKKTKKFISLKNSVNSFFNGFAGIYNSKIFERDHLSEKINIEDEILSEIIDETYSICFRKFTSDILGNTYESYLGHELILQDGLIKVVPNETIQKAGGIYYTPEYIVIYILKNSLGKILEKIMKQAEELYKQGDFNGAVDFFKQEITKIKILDPSCGSGTFLIKAFVLIQNYYEKMNELINKMNKELPQKYGREWFVHVINEFIDYEYEILQNNLFGVDLDPQAVEITSVNLILHALKKDNPLPLILDENIKIGNTLISFNHDWELPEQCSSELKTLLEQRKTLKQTEDMEKKHNIMKNMQELKENLYNAIEDDIIKLIGEDFADDSILVPFIWEIEFPEIFIDKIDRKLNGFDIVIGNPPYIGGNKIKSDIKLFEKGDYLDISYKCRPHHPDEQPNIYLFFLVRALNLINKKGIVSFIIPQEWKFHNYAQDFRDYFLDKSKAIKVLNFHPEFRVFPGIGTTSLIIAFSNRLDDEYVILSKMNFQENIKVKSLLDNYDLGQIIPDKFTEEDLELFVVSDKKNLVGERWEIRSKLFRVLKEKFTGSNYVSLNDRNSFLFLEDSNLLLQ